MNGEHHDDGNNSHGFGTDGFQMMGMINALKTGDVATDMIIAMCVPFVLKFLFGWVNKLEDVLDWEMWVRWFTTRPNADHERFISHSTTRDHWGSTSNADDDNQNSVLLKAIKMYLHQVVQLKLKSAYLDLTGMEDKNCGGYYDYGGDSDDDDDEDDGNNYGSRTTFVGMLSRYKIINRLPNDEWHNLGMYGKIDPAIVMMQIENNSRKEEEENNGDKKTRNIEVNNTTFHFTSPGDGAIDAFIDTAYQWYIAELRKLEDHARYLYEMKVPEIKIGGNNDDNDGDSSGTTYQRYKLSDEKSFESLFFREKDSLLGLVDHFSNKSGKYSIKGYPHKLGVLLHGPPGTGKTSLIKAMAQYTGRSIVNVPLSKVSTNSELMSIFFDRKYQVEGASVSVKLGFKDVIFVMEDVDAASKIVKRRDGKTSAEVVEPQRIDLPMPKSLWRMFLESASSDCKDLVEQLEEKSEKLKEEAEKLKPEVLKAIAQRVTSLPALGLVGEGVDDPTIGKLCEEALESCNKQNEQYSKLDEIMSSHAQAIKALLDSGTQVDDKFVDELLGEARSLSAPISATVSKPSGSDKHDTFNESEAQSYFPSSSDSGSSSDSSGPKKKGLGFGSSFFRPNPDQLSLSGLLNVLDGVVDTPGRIVIMTTNHPEMLDPALIRPGRIDKKLLLGYMAAADIVGMLEHYFQTTLTSSQMARVEMIVDGSRLKLTPAQVEQLAVEHDELDDMIGAMEKMGRPPSLAKFVSKSNSTVALRS